MLLFSCCQLHRAYHPAELTKNSQWRVRWYCSVRFRRKLLCFRFWLLVLCYHDQPEEYRQWILRTRKSLVQAGRFGTCARMEMNSIGARHLFFALTFRLSTRGFFFFTRRKIPSTDRWLVLVVNWLPTNCLLGSMLGESELFDAAYGFQRTRKRYLIVAPLYRSDGSLLLLLREK